MKSIDKLLEWSRWLDSAYATEEGGHYHVYNYPLTSSMKSCGELMREKCDEIEAEIAERYMPLPVDADGVPIHVGDEMVDSKTSRTVVAVAPKSFMMDGYETGSFYRPGLAKNHHHVKPRTLEDVLVDMLEAAVGYSDAHTDVSLVAVEKYADEIRELLGGDAS